MTLSIQHPDIDQLAHELCEMTGESPAQAVLTALRERLERQKRTQVLADELNQIADRCAKLPILDERSEDEILGYTTNPVDHVFGSMGQSRNTDDVMKELRGRYFSELTIIDPGLSH